MVIENSLTVVPFHSPETLLNSPVDVFPGSTRTFEIPNSSSLETSLILFAGIHRSEA